MKPSLSMKTLYRSPIKTILTFILLAVVTFAFFSQTAEYAITAREFNTAAGQYCGVGSAEIAPPTESDPSDPVLLALNDTATHLYQPLTQEQISAISLLPYITSTDTRYMTAGFSDTYYRLDDGRYFYNFTARCIVEGTLKSVVYHDGLASNNLILTDCTLLAGNPNWDVEQEPLGIFACPFIPDYEMGGGTVGRSIQILTPNYKFDTAYLKTLTMGNRYVFVLRFEPLYNNSAEITYTRLSDHLSETWCKAVQSIDGALADYLESDKFAPLRELIEITNADTHTFDMVYTEDMSAIMRFAEGDMVIIDGRALTREDSANGANVCVVSREFVEANELNVGDAITMKLGTQLFEQYKNLGAVAATPERYALPEETATLEIVGIYTDIDGPNKQSREPHWSYSINTIFVPTSLLPAKADALSGHEFSPAEFSFKVENAWDIPSFLEQTAPIIKEMGLKLIFDDDGWTDIAQGFQATKQLSLIKIAVLSVAVAAATGFVVYLFVGRKKKEYAVMRALGTIKKISARALILPLMAVATISVLAGSGAAWIYTVKTIAHSNTFSILKEYSVSTAVPMGAAIGSIVGEIVLALLFALVMLRRIGTVSPLALLQDNGNSQARGKKKSGREKPAQIETTSPMMEASSVRLVSTFSYVAAPVDTSSVSIERTRLGHKSRSPWFVLRYIGRHIRRSAGKSTLAILLAVLLFVAVGQFALMKQSYVDVCTNTVLKSNFVGGLQLGVMPKILEKDYVTDPFYEARQFVELNFSRTDVVITNNIPRYIGQDVDITYTDGFDSSVMDRSGDILIVGKALMEMYGLELGDTVQITYDGFLEKLQLSLISRYAEEHPDNTASYEALLVLLQDEIIEGYNLKAQTYTIAGIVSTPTGAYESLAFTPGSNNPAALFGPQVSLDVAEFTLSDNFRADEFRAYAEQVSGASSTGRISFVMDTSELENLMNSLRLTETLYPVAVVAALLIGGFLCCLTILQSSKEAAIMRILGTTKGKTRTLIALEQIFLAVAGLVIGACALLLFKGSELTEVSHQIYLFAALYFAVVLVSAVICSAVATRRNILELLQTKE